MTKIVSRPLLISFASDFAADEQLRKVVDGLSEILSWYQCLPGQLFVVSTTTALDLAETIEILFKQNGMRHMFYVAELNPIAIQGRLPNDAWAVITQAQAWLELNPSPERTPSTQ